MNTYPISIEAIENAFIIHCKGKRMLATSEELPKKICDIIPFLGVKPENGLVHFYIDCCSDEQLEQAHPDITDELFAAKVRYLQFNLPDEDDVMPVLDFNGESIPKEERRIEIFGDWAVKIHEEIDKIPLRTSHGVHWVIVGANPDTYKMIGRIKHKLLEVTDESIMEWNRKHPSLILPDIK